MSLLDDSRKKDARRRAERNGRCEPARPVEPARPGSGGARAADRHLTDKGNARCVVERHGGDLRYCHPFKTFFVWDGRRWAEDLTGEAERRVKETQDYCYATATAELRTLEGGRGGDEDDRKEDRKALLKATLANVLRWEDYRRTVASLAHVRSEPGVPVLPAQLDADPMLLNVLNGTIDLRTGELRPHRREDLVTKLAPVAYDEDASCPQWMRFLRRVMADKDGLVSYLQRVVGYCLTGDVSEQTLWFLHGCGSNGKSTFLGVLLDILGDYGTQATSELLMAKSHEAHPAERADLFGRRCVATIETEEGKRMAEALMKQLTGCDRIKARKMHKDFFEFKPTHKILLAANHKPTVRGTDYAVWRRIKLVPFTVTIPEGEKDKGLPEKLKAERSGVLRWAVAGCVAWRSDGLAEPDEVRRATAEYQAEQDTLGEFLAARCFVHPDARVKAAALLEVYAVWSGDKWMNAKRFGRLIRDRGHDAKRESQGVFYQGVGLHEAAADVGL